MKSILSLVFLTLSLNSFSQDLRDHDGCVRFHQARMPGTTYASYPGDGEQFCDSESKLSVFRNSSYQDCVESHLHHGLENVEDAVAQCNSLSLLTRYNSRGYKKCLEHHHSMVTIATCQMPGVAQLYQEQIEKEEERARRIRNCQDEVGVLYSTLRWQEYQECLNRKPQFPGA